MKRSDFAAELARRRADPGLSLADLAARAHLHRGYAGNVEHGHRWPTETVARALDAALDADGALLAIWAAADRVPRERATNGPPTELLELAARAEASDVSPTTLDLLDTSIATIARAYTRIPPAELLNDARTNARHIGKLLDGRSTLTQRRRLFAAAGWTALLAATLHVDLGQRDAGNAARTVASSLGRETGSDEIGAWAGEIDTWTAIIDQDWPLAAALAEAGEAIAPRRQLRSGPAGYAVRASDGPPR